MLKIDECPDDQKRNENPVGDRHLAREPLPDPEEEQCGNEFHREIPKRNFFAAIRAATAKHQPADQRKILIPGDRLLAVRAKRATRPIDRQINRPAIDADI